MGRVNFGGSFVGGGMAGVLVDPRRGTAMQIFRRFLGSGSMIGGIGLYMNRGNDK